MLVYGVGFHTSIQIFLLFFFFKDITKSQQQLPQSVL